MNRFFQKVATLQSGTHDGDLTVNIENLIGNLAEFAESSNNIITIDGSANGSRVTGDLTVNHQVGTIAANKKSVFVRASDKYALYAQAALNKNITVNNGGNLFFGKSSTTAYNNRLGGIRAGTSGTGNVTVTNSATIGFASACTSSCGKIRAVFLP